jgi:hypothetical protein
VTDPKFGGEPAAEAIDPDADPVAVKILIAARERLIRTLAAVRVPELRGPVVLGGTVAKRLPGLTAAVIGSFGPDLEDAAAGGGTVGTAAPEVRIVPDGVVGAAVLALRNAGVAVDQELFDRVTASLADIRR